MKRVSVSLTLSSLRVKPLIEDKIECKGHIKAHNIILHKSEEKANSMLFGGFICPCKKIFLYKCAFIDFAVAKAVLLNTTKSI